MPFKPLSVATAILIFAATAANAQSPIATHPSDPIVSTDEFDASSHPQLSANDAWAGKLSLIILLGLFVPAAIVGPLLRKKSSDELPEMHNREERNPHTASQHQPGRVRPGA